ncbi:MAG: hypothetical protein ACODAB_04790 [Gemmatimonadota bacterium]
MKYALTAGPAVLALTLTSFPSIAVAQDAPALVPLAAVAAEPTLEAVAAATERFKDVNVALAEGFIRDPMNICETAEMLGRPANLGVMGVHYFRPDRLMITATEPLVDGTSLHTDFLEPSILIYEPQADGSLELVAVENLVFKQAWEAAGNPEPPTFQGAEYNLMVDDPATPEIDEAHQFAPHHDLHVWLYRDNPNGMFAQFNPAVSCEHHRVEVGGGH